MEDPFARALLARTPQLSATALRALLAAAGGDLRAALTPAARRALALPEPAARWLAAPDRAAVEADLGWCARSGTRLLLAIDADYPPALQPLGAAPAALYLQGEPATLAAPSLALTGTRHPSRNGLMSARDLAASFARAGLTLAVGLSAGIEAAAAEAALAAGGRVLGVCGVALDALGRLDAGTLPARIAASGALLSELPPRTAPARPHFSARLRLLGALALGTLVIEAARRGAPMTLARHALEQGRAVLAVPGSIHDPRSRGPHQLLREGATLVEGAADVWAELGNLFPAPTLSAPPAPAAAGPALDKEYEMLLDAVGFEPATVDILAARTQLPSESIASMLLILELQGRVAALPGGRYGRKP